MNTKGTILVLLVLSTAYPLGAQTPDGQPPSAEDVCTAAGLVGAAWGLCNAYCEALDCDSDDPKASAKACSRVRANFQRTTGGDELPCEAVCPCSLPIDFDSPLWGGEVVVVCDPDRTGGVGFPQSVLFTFVDVTIAPRANTSLCQTGFRRASDLPFEFFEREEIAPREFQVCSQDVLAYLRALREARPDIAFSGADLDTCEPISPPE